MKEFHDTPLGEHGGFLKTYKLMMRELFWEGMKLDIHKYIRAYEVCQQMKYHTLSPTGLLQPLPIPKVVW